MTIADVAHRGFNLLAVSLLAIGGLEFGSVLLQEQDFADKIDDGGFLLMAIIAIGWYLVGDNRFRRSLVPMMLAGLAVVVQVIGLILERDDPKAFGDNIGGALFFVPVLLLVAIQYRRTAALLSPRTAATRS